MQTILLTGVTGQVGWELWRALSPLGRVVALDNNALDLTDADAIRRAVSQHKPSLIVNPAAYTAVDRAEQERETAYAVNATAPAVLAEQAKGCGAILVHYSTDYVFDGAKPEPYVEEDTPNPLNAYGASKLAGEEAIRASGVRHLILRTSWVYGTRGHNFLLTMQRLMREREELRIVDDQVGAPTWSRLIAEATALILAQCLSPARGADRPEPWGTYHLTCSGATSWFGFAQAIAELGGHPTRLVPIPSSEYPTPARRPANSRLNNGKLARVFGLRLPDWREALRLCLDPDR
ncbi:MAG: dTDP-4-dehydrorhamnose reductase [Thiobacillaceae bacterium]|nr:dTDP-4-dehydrorhamnose reductase [Thiobacillaceae bacterium]MCX7673831.1 dTDP-4-dehydrorhamnose reductase [Thiobacillaceae bacterium]MDW8323589.1 dTDP-4-dehydrorhamnose reductase [Burkholderiales bacterium]